MDMEKRILVDFNTTMQDVEHDGTYVRLGLDAEMAAGVIPNLDPGEQVIAYDDEMAVHGSVVHQPPFWFAALDWETLTRTAPGQ